MGTERSQESSTFLTITLPKSIVLKSWSAQSSWHVANGCENGIGRLEQTKTEADTNREFAVNPTSYLDESDV